MAGRESWIERQQRLVRCKIHGLHYDPKLTSGCSICRKQAQPKRRSPQLAILLLLVLGIVFVGLQLLTPWLESSKVEAGLDTRTAVADTARGRSPARAPRLDPEVYRGGIESIEAVFFQPQTSDLAEIRDQLTSAGQRLSRDLESTPGESATAAAATLDGLVERWLASVTTRQDLDRARSQWIEARDRTFEEAPWFGYPTSDSGQVDRAALVAYRDVAAEIEALSAEGLGQIPAESADAAAPAGIPAMSPEQLAAERQWWGEWRRRVDELPAQLPERPGTRASAQVLAAVAQLEQALHQLRQLAADPNLARRADAAVALEDLASLAAAISRDFDELLVA